MSFLKVNKSATAVEENTGGNYIGKSGIYPVTIKTVSVKVNEHNARSLNFNIIYNGNEQVFYGLNLDKNNGEPVDHAVKILNGLAIIAGLDIINEPEIETHVLGADKIETELSVLTDFSGLEVQMRVKEVFSKYKGEIRESKEIKGFYRADGASASEIVNDSKPGEQLAKVIASPATTEPIYRANQGANEAAPTAEEVTAWLKAKSEARQGNKSAPSKPAAPNTFDKSSAAKSTFPA